MNEEFNLSKWIFEDYKDSGMNMVEAIWIKEFIKILNDLCCERCKKLVNKLAGDKLVEKKEDE